MTEGGVAEAKTLFKRASELDRDNHWWNIALAEIAVKDSDFEEAIRLLEPLADGKVDEPQVLRLYGAGLYGAGRREEAVEQFDRALALRPGDAGLRLDRGRALVVPGAGGQPTAAMSALFDMIADGNDASAFDVVATIGLERLSEHRIATAIEDFSLVLSSDPQHADCLAYRAMAHTLNGEEGFAKADLAAAVRNGLSESKKLMLLVDTYMLARNPRAATDAASKLIELDSSPEAYAKRAVARLADQDYRGCLADLEIALAEESLAGSGYYSFINVIALASAERLDDAVQAFERYEQAHVVSETESVIWSSLLMQGDRPLEALETVKAAIAASETESGALLLMRGRANQELLYFSRALADYEKADAADAPIDEVAFHRALCLDDMGKQEEAVQALGPAVEFDSGLREVALATRARLRMSLGEADAALVDVNTALESSPDSASLYALRAAVLASLGRSREQSLADCNRALDLEPENQLALRERSVLNAELDYDAAVEDLKQLARIEGADSEHYLRTEARFYAERREWDKQAEPLRRLLSDAPDDMDLLWSLGASYDNSGKFEDAEALFRRIALRTPTDVGARLSVAITLSQQQESEAAVAAFRECLVGEREAATNWMNDSLEPGILRAADQVLADWERAGGVSLGAFAPEVPTET